jgi:CheY-like chemotaxis protein
MADLLIVDDNVDLAELLDGLLRSEGYGTRVAHDGQAGLGALNERLPDAVLLDVDMPVLDGPGMVYRMLLEDCGKENIPIVLVSGAVTLDAVARAVGTPYVLTKPFTLGQLLPVVERALAERTPPRPPK